jgi:hypothetical protein
MEQAPAAVPALRECDPFGSCGAIFNNGHAADENASGYLAEIPRRKLLQNLLIFAFPPYRSQFRQRAQPEKTLSP